MRMSYNARHGMDYYEPETDFMKALVCPKGAVHAEFMAFCDRLGLERQQLDVLKEWGDDEICGLTLDLALALGIEQPDACRLVAKAQALSQRAKEGDRRMKNRLRAQLLLMLRREDELRLSSEVQAKYAQQPDCWDWKWQVTDEVQRQVCEEFGFANNVGEGLDLLRSALSLYPGDAEIKDAAHYLRNNIHTDCPLQVGEIVPDLPLHKGAGGETSVHQLAPAAGDGMTLIIAGSHT